MSAGPQRASVAANALPRPTLARWQPLRGGLLNLYRYDYEEFRFEQGHLLLRGNNGTGKSRVLALQLPFLLDGEVAPHRLEPDGDAAKRIEWNLLLGKYPDRLGYTWLEFGRRDAEGQLHYFTLGCGLNAVEGRGLVGKWFFVTPRRIGDELHLATPAGRPLSRDGLVEALEGAGEVFTSAREYRRAVDRALFQLGEQRYDALVDLLIQLRQPQLSRKLDEAKLSSALSDALSPLATPVVEEVAEAFRSLESDRDALDGYRAAGRAVNDFLREYRRYAQIAARRRAERVRSHHAEYEGRQRQLRGAEEERRRVAAELEATGQRLEELAVRERETEQVVETLKESPEMRSVHELERAGKEADERRQQAQRAQEDHRAAVQARETRERESETAEEAARTTWARVRETNEQALQAARAAGLEQSQREVIELLGLPDARSAGDVDAARERVDEAARRQRRAAERLQQWTDACELAERALAHAKERQSDRSSQLAKAIEEQHETHKALEAALRSLAEEYRAWFSSLKELAPADPDLIAEQLGEWRHATDAPNPVPETVARAHNVAVAQLSRLRSELEEQRSALASGLGALREERAQVEAGVHEAPPSPHTRGADARSEKPGAPLWQLCDFAAEVGEELRAPIEAALEASGLLDAWVTPEGELSKAGEHDTLLVAGRSPRPAAQERQLAGVLVPCIDPADTRASAVSEETVSAVLQHIGFGNGAGHIWVAGSGEWQVGPLHGRWSKPAAQHIGQGAREAARRARLERLSQQILELEQQSAALERSDENLRGRQAQAGREAEEAPKHREVDRGLANLEAASRGVDASRLRLAEAEGEVAGKRAARDEAERVRDEGAADLGLPQWLGRLRELESAIADYSRIAQGLWSEIRHQVESRLAADQALERAREARAEQERRQQQYAELHARAQAAAARRDTLESSIGAQVSEILERLAHAERELQATRDGREKTRDVQADLRGQVQVAEHEITTRREALEAATASRAEAVARLHGFVETELLSVALPEAAQAEPRSDSMAANVELARRIEAELQQTACDDAAWERNKNGILRHIEALKDALLPGGYEPETRLDDDLFVVRVPFQGRLCGATELERGLREEIGEREAILDAREREVIENHLIQDIATHLHDRMRDAEQFVSDMNHELAARPMSTGMSLRFAWRPVEDGPEGFKQARRSLLSAGETWSPEERRALGTFLQQQIQSERAANDTGTWQEQLEAALDYRAWHRFEVERHQDGQWKRLTRRTHGTGSGGEKAIALTIPQFAAAAAHYASADKNAPRLILLDEAFVGVDADMRSKCMDLLCTFDLDFVMTSEREWGCYSTLNGVAIYQLATRPGIDAVGVTRWVWNGERYFRDEPLLPSPTPPLADDAAAAEVEESGA